jgi:hypothetical protein
MWRGSVLEFFTFIATNNDATRKIYADFSDVGLMADFNAWAISHPDLALNEVPEAGAEL